MSIRVVVVGDDPLARAGIIALLSQHDVVSLVGQGSSSELPRQAEVADVVVWDAGSSPLTLEAENNEAARILVLTNDERYVAQALAQGARGALPREVLADRLAAAVSAVHEGLIVVDESFSDALAVRPGPMAPLVEPLTSRELEVLALLGEGLSNKMIASRLEISESTAKFHVAAILGKLGVGSRAEAIVQAARHGLVIL